MNLAADLASLADRRGWKTRPAYFAAHRTWTHGQVHDLAARTATTLAARGVKAGDRVLLALPDTIGWLASFLAVARLGAVAVLTNPELTADDHTFLVEDSQAVLSITESELEWRFDRRRWLDVDRLRAEAMTATPMTAAHPVDPDAPLYIQYTSGTTGKPKGAVHGHRDPAIYHDTVGVRVFDLRPTDVTLSISKLYFAYGFGNAFALPLYSGSAAVLIRERPTPERVRELADRHRVTLLYAVPSAYAALTRDRAGRPDPAFATVRAAVSAGEALPSALGARVTELVNAPVLEQIGTTEVGHAFCANSVTYNTPETVGRPVPGYQVRLRDAAATGSATTPRFGG